MRISSLELSTRFAFVDPVKHQHMDEVILKYSTKTLCFSSCDVYLMKITSLKCAACNAHKLVVRRRVQWIELPT